MKPMNNRGKRDDSGAVGGEWLKLKMSRQSHSPSYGRTVRLLPPTSRSVLKATRILVLSLEANGEG